MPPAAIALGERLFFGRRFKVTQDTLDPRPETELLVQTALERPFVRMLDLGTGTGCILLSCLAGMPIASGVGTDLSPAALAVAAENAARLGLVAGAPICHFGVVTGESCGTVERVNNRWFTMTNGVVSQKGDSGGPVYVLDGNRAVLVGLFNGRRRLLHDIILGTVVINSSVRTQVTPAARTY